ncbi:response regulator transcription factor (plasmid) [Deinococcus radiomollis]|uniref:response regulator transcription factor n=1 Tax=Deinococcus radiomollis TaxID=468916 RepID=UPI003891F467
MPVLRLIVLIEHHPYPTMKTTEVLEGAGFEVMATMSVKRGLVLARTLRPVLVITGVKFRSGDGTDVVRGLLPFGIPVMVVSANDDVALKVALLEAGAVDYVVRPYKASELLTRVTLRLRSQPVRAQREGLVVDELTLDVNQCRLLVGEQNVDLTKREWGMLEVMMREPDRAFTYQELHDQLWGPGLPVSSVKRNGLAVLMSSIRRKLEAAGVERPLTPVRGTGYVLRRQEARRDGPLSARGVRLPS